MLEDIKLLLGIEEDDEDKLLELLHSTAKRQVLSKLRGLDKDIQFIPDDLSHIPMELVVIRYNKIGSEGIEQENVEGYSATYGSNDLSSYTEEIQEYINNKSGADPEQRLVRFL